MVLLAAIALVGVCMNPAYAASRSCRQLEAQLASAERGGRASPVQIGKYDSAIARQGEEIAKARSRSRRAGCGFSLFGQNVAACAALNASIDRMNGNLDTLRSQRAKLSKGVPRSDRARIKAALIARNCRSEAVANKRPAERKNSGQRFLDELAHERTDDARIFDEQAGADDGSYLDELADLTFERPPQPQGEFRTMCVRTCDGYFYPMSNAASLRDFERDQKNCESSCPGTKMQVFYTRGVGDDPARMMSSASGRPYAELPTAYLYKKPGVETAPACGCNAMQGFEIIGGNASERQQQGEPKSASITSFVASEPVKPDRATPSAPMTQPEPDAASADRNVRVVGPAFLPDPKAAIDLRVQDPKPDP